MENWGVEVQCAWSQHPLLTCCLPPAGDDALGCLLHVLAGAGQADGRHRGGEGDPQAPRLTPHPHQRQVVAVRALRPANQSNLIHLRK